MPEVTYDIKEINVEMASYCPHPGTPLEIEDNSVILLSFPIL